MGEAAMNQLVAIGSPTLPALVAAAGERASMRFLEFFAANIRNRHTRRAYARAADEFLGWCASVGVPSIAAVQPVHVAAWIEAATRELAAPLRLGIAFRRIQTGLRWQAQNGPLLHLPFPRRSGCHCRKRSASTPRHPERHRRSPRYREKTTPRRF